MSNFNLFKQEVTALVEYLKSSEESDPVSEDSMVNLDKLFEKYGYSTVSRLFITSDEDIKEACGGLSPTESPFTFREKVKLAEHELFFIELIEAIDLDNISSHNTSLILTLKNIVLGTILKTTRGYIITAHPDSIFGFVVNDEKDEMYFKHVLTDQLTIHLVQIPQHELASKIEANGFYYSYASIHENEMEMYDQWYSEIEDQYLNHEPINHFIN